MTLWKRSWVTQHFHPEWLLEWKAGHLPYKGKFKNNHLFLVQIFTMLKFQLLLICAEDYKIRSSMARICTVFEPVGETSGRSLGFIYLFKNRVMDRRGQKNLLSTGLPSKWPQCLGMNQNWMPGAASVFIMLVVGSKHLNHSNCLPGPFSGSWIRSGTPRTWNTTHIRC